MKICTTHTPMPFDLKYTHTFQNKNLTKPHNTILQEYKKSQIQA